MYFCSPSCFIRTIMPISGRNTKIESMQENVKDLKTQNSKLQEQEKILRGQYEQVLFCCLYFCSPSLI